MHRMKKDSKAQEVVRQLDLEEQKGEVNKDEEDKPTEERKDPQPETGAQSTSQGNSIPSVASSGISLQQGQWAQQQYPRGFLPGMVGSPQQQQQQQQQQQLIWQGLAVQQQQQQQQREWQQQQSAFANQLGTLPGWGTYMGHWSMQPTMPLPFPFAAAGWSQGMPAAGNFSLPRTAAAAGQGPAAAISGGNPGGAGVSAASEDDDCDDPTETGDNPPAQGR